MPCSKQPTRRGRWYVVPADDRKRARLNVILHLLRHIPYEQPEREKVKLPKRQEPDGYVESDYPYKIIADVESTHARGASTRFDTDRRAPTAKIETP
jgi:hypothetical protein